MFLSTEAEKEGIVSFWGGLEYLGDNLYVSSKAYSLTHQVPHTRQAPIV